MNKVIEIGRIIKDPEVKVFQKKSGDGDFQVAQFTIAVKDRDKTKFFPCEAYNGTALFLEKYIKKGSRIACFGSLDIKDWTDKDGNKRKSFYVAVREVEFADGYKADDKDNDFVNLPDGLVEELPFPDEEAVNMILREFTENTSALSGESNGES